jgi:hypoxanthine phosphoribosyltransferase
MACIVENLPTKFGVIHTCPQPSEKLLSSHETRYTMVQLHDKTFAPYITADQIEEAIVKLAEKITADMQGKRPVFLGVLNGSFLFIADLMKHIDLECEISFVKLSSYEGTSSSGTVKELIGVNDSLKGRSVIIVEDIVDTGVTIENLVQKLEEMEVAEIKIATLLFKPTAYQKTQPIDYCAIEIPNEFVVGYGLDYDGLGRNLNDIYKITED